MIWPALPRRELVALRLWLGTFFPFQLEWVVDFNLASVLVKSRRIGGSYSIAAAVALWTLFGETTFIVSVGQSQADGFLRQTKWHAQVLAGLGSEWARPARREYVFNGDTLQLLSGGQATSMPSTNPARSFGGNVVLDEFAYHVAPGKVWESAAPATALGEKRLRVLSTPNGIGGLFHEMCESPDEAYRYWRRHKVKLSEARAQGYQISVQAMRRIDRGIPALHAQFFECSFQARGASLFHGVTHYDELPKSGYRVAIGLDMAYTSKTSSDWNVAVVMYEAAGVYYVARVVREKGPNFAPTLRMLHAAYPTAKMHWYPAVAEEGMGVQLFVESRLPVYRHKITKDKYARALPLAEMWNFRDPEGNAAGRVRVPRTAPWLADYVNEVSTFHGGKTHADQHDDQVDASVSAFDALHEGEGEADQFGVVKTHFKSGGVLMTAQGPAPGQPSGWLRW